MQMTGYMFRSAEYRRSLLKSLDGDQSSPLLPSAEESGPGLPEVSGTIKVKLGGSMEAEVDAGAYMAELRKEVEVLRGELVAQRQANEEQGGGGLLAFVQAAAAAVRTPPGPTANECGSVGSARHAAPRGGGQPVRLG